MNKKLVAVGVLLMLLSPIFFGIWEWVQVEQEANDKQLRTGTGTTYYEWKDRDSDLQSIWMGAALGLLIVLGLGSYFVVKGMERY